MEPVATDPKFDGTPRLLGLTALESDGATFAARDCLAPKPVFHCACGVWRARPNLHEVCNDLPKHPSTSMTP